MRKWNSETLRNFSQNQKNTIHSEAEIQTQFVRIAKVFSTLPFGFLFSIVESSVSPGIFQLSICGTSEDLCFNIHLMPACSTGWWVLWRQGQSSEKDKHSTDDFILPLTIHPRKCLPISISFSHQILPKRIEMSITACPCMPPPGVIYPQPCTMSPTPTVAIVDWPRNTPITHEWPIQRLIYLSGFASELDKIRGANQSISWPWTKKHKGKFSEGSDIERDGGDGWWKWWASALKLKEKETMRSSGGSMLGRRERKRCTERGREGTQQPRRNKQHPEPGVALFQPFLKPASQCFSGFLSACVLSIDNELLFYLRELRWNSLQLKKFFFPSTHFCRALILVLLEVVTGW